MVRHGCLMRLEIFTTRACSKNHQRNKQERQQQRLLRCREQRKRVRPIISLEQGLLFVHRPISEHMPNLRRQLVRAIKHLPCIVFNTKKKKKQQQQQQ